MKTKDPICPECKGSKGTLKQGRIIANGLPNPVKEIDHFVPCWYCAGTGYASDDETEKEFWRES